MSDSFCRYKRFKAPMYCTNATMLGHGTWEVLEGDFILYKEYLADDSYNVRFARVLGLATHDGCGKKYMSEPCEGSKGRKSKPKPEPRLLVMALSDSMTFAYERHVKLGDVVKILSAAKRPELFSMLRWFLFGKPPEPELAVRFMNYGSCSDGYISKYLSSPEGEIRADWHEVAMGRAK